MKLNKDKSAIMEKDFSTCSISMEPYDLQKRIPKSLDCQHSLCALCLASHLQSQNCCPSCRKPIQNPDNVTNDLTMIDYLDRQREHERMEQQNAMRNELQSLLCMMEKGQQRTEAAIIQFRNNKMKSIKEKRRLFNTYSKFVMAESLEYCNTEAGLARIASKYEDELECSLDVLQGPLIIIKSLLESEHIGKEDFDNCQMQAISASRMERKAKGTEEGILDTYRDVWLEQVTNISKGSPYRDPDDAPGNVIFVKLSIQTYD